ncbi:hypothetical protein RHSIM_Rhsim09G0069600 [Rhododendron simsii]|uniref:Uncharacterized protein n=1 Tax=Rhododendron simsii TaxID=118357 RepID=A0A834GKS5_RHOSS|nr:hypothetical protein RHSIM_Rhsim09G0069600 [Rhododendron simsii]
MFNLNALSLKAAKALGEVQFELSLSLSLSQWRGEEGSQTPRGSMEDVQQPRPNRSPHHYFLDCVGVVQLRGARTADAWVVAATERCLSYSGQRTRPTMIVKRTIQMIISVQPSSSNVLCSNYDKSCDFHVISSFFPQTLITAVLPGDHAGRREYSPCFPQSSSSGLSSGHPVDLDSSLLHRCHLSLLVNIVREQRKDQLKFNLINNSVGNTPHNGLVGETRNDFSEPMKNPKSEVVGKGLERFDALSSGCAKSYAQTIKDSDVGNEIDGEEKGGNDVDNLRGDRDLNLHGDPSKHDKEQVEFLSTKKVETNGQNWVDSPTPTREESMDPSESWDSKSMDSRNDLVNDEEYNVSAQNGFKEDKFGPMGSMYIQSTDSLHSASIGPISQQLLQDNGLNEGLKFLEVVKAQCQREDLCNYPNTGATRWYIRGLSLYGSEALTGQLHTMTLGPSYVGSLQPHPVSTPRLGTDPDGLGIYLALRIMNQLETNHDDNSGMIELCKIFQSFPSTQCLLIAPREKRQVLDYSDSLFLYCFQKSKDWRGSTIRQIRGVNLCWVIAIVEVSSLFPSDYDVPLSLRMVWIRSCLVADLVIQVLEFLVVVLGGIEDRNHWRKRCKWKVLVLRLFAKGASGKLDNTSCCGGGCCWLDMWLGGEQNHWRRSVLVGCWCGGDCWLDMWLGGLQTIGVEVSWLALAVVVDVGWICGLADSKPLALKVQVEGSGAPPLCQGSEWESWCKWNVLAHLLLDKGASGNLVDVVVVVVGWTCGLADSKTIGVEAAVVVVDVGWTCGLADGKTIGVEAVVVVVAG